MSQPLVLQKMSLVVANNTRSGLWKGLAVISNKHFHLSAVTCLKGHGKEWRNSKGKAINKSLYGPLTDLPDYSFLDGRPTPLTPAQQRRRQERISVAKDIMEQLKQIDFAKDRHEKMESARKQEIQSILDNKLKAKS